MGVGDDGAFLVQMEPECAAGPVWWDLDEFSPFCAGAAEIDLGGVGSDVSVDNDGLIVRGGVVSFFVEVGCGDASGRGDVAVEPGGGGVGGGWAGGGVGGGWGGGGVGGGAGGGLAPEDGVFGGEDGFWHGLEGESGAADAVDEVGGEGLPVSDGCADKFAVVGDVVLSVGGCRGCGGEYVSVGGGVGGGGGGDDGAGGEAGEAVGAGG